MMSLSMVGNDDRPELGGGLVVVSLLRLIQRKSLYHTINVLESRELDRIVGVFRCTGWPAYDGLAFCNERC